MSEIPKELETRQAILKAAKEVFIEKGLNGARMQEIADKATINKALLHYHFSNKALLFDTIFAEAFSEFWPKINAQLVAQTPFKQLLRSIISAYFDMLYERPYLAIFILNELHHNPERLERLIKDTGFEPDTILAKIDDEIKKGNCYPFSAAEIVTNMISLSIFPFVGKPLLQRIWFKNDSNSYQQFLENRKETLIQFIENALYKTN